MSGLSIWASLFRSSFNPGAALLPKKQSKGGPLWQLYQHTLEGRVIVKPTGERGVVVSSRHHDYMRGFKTHYLVRWQGSLTPSVVSEHDVRLFLTPQFANETWVPAAIRVAQLNKWNIPTRREFRALLGKLKLQRKSKAAHPANTPAKAGKQAKAAVSDVNVTEQTLPAASSPKAADNVVSPATPQSSPQKLGKGKKSKKATGSITGRSAGGKPSALNRRCVTSLAVTPTSGETAGVAKPTARSAFDSVRSLMATCAHILQDYFAGIYATETTETNVADEITATVSVPMETAVDAALNGLVQEVCPAVPVSDITDKLKAATGGIQVLVAENEAALRLMLEQGSCV